MTAVLGGGLAGLSAGYYLLRRFAEPVTIYEATNRVGGWIRTERHRDKGFIFEMGARTIRPKGKSGANTLEMIEDLQLNIDAIPSSHAAAKNRMIYAKGELCMLPNSLGSTLKTLPPFSSPLASALLTDLRTKPLNSKKEDESIYEFVKRRFGTELAEYAISPLICGICAGDAKDISVRFLLNDLFEKEQQYGGVVKGIVFGKVFGKKIEDDMEGLFAHTKPALYAKAETEKWSMYRLRNGLESFPRALADYLRQEGVDIQLGAECNDIHFLRESGIKMNIKGREVEAQHIFSALPAYKLAPCVKDQHPSLCALLNSIQYVDVAVINLQYNSTELLKQKAFGFLVPPIERLPILGVIFDSCCFDMNGNTVLTVMMGGKWFEEHFGKSPGQKELLDIALEQLERILGIDLEPKMTRVNVLRKCIPQYTVGHNQRITDIRRYIERYKLPLSLCGAAYDGVGVNDVIFSARKQVYALPALVSE